MANNNTLPMSESVRDAFSRRLIDVNKQIEVLEKERHEILVSLGKNLKDLRICSYCGSSKYYAKGLCVNCYERLLRNGTLEPKRKPKKPPVIKPITPWRLKLGIKVFGSEFTPPDDYDESVDYILSTLTEKEQNILLHRFKDKKTLKQCGEMFGVTCERARQIEAKACRKLRHPARSIYFTAGMKKAKELKEERERMEKEEIEEKERQKAIQERITMELSAPVSISDLAEFSIGVLSNQYPDCSIENMNPSVRTYNVLYRAGLTTINQIIDFVDGDDANLLRLRNCGLKTAEEIMILVYRYVNYVNQNKKQIEKKEAESK